MNGWLLTSSWDDGDPEDLRLADRLVAAGLSATFYVCRDYDGRPRLTDSEIRGLEQLPGIEVGAHSLTHPDLRRVDDKRLLDEVGGSRRWLEDVLGREVTSFCYPSGLHDRRAARAAAAAGYTLARTTMNGSTSLDFDRFRMPATQQFFPHSRVTQLRHSAKERNMRGVLRFATLRRWSRSPSAVARELINSRRGNHGVLHFWGHSWELARYGLWAELDALIELLDDFDCPRMTNTELVHHLTSRAVGT